MNKTKQFIWHHSLGLSLIELMIAIAISSFLMLGLTATFKNSSDAQRALERSSQLIENGRYAVNILYEDLRHAGYFGHFFESGTPPAAFPDPCETGSLSNLEDAMGMPLQGYTASSLTGYPTITSMPSTCTTILLANSNLSPGSDVLIMRRADTDVFTGSPNTNEVYIQSNSRTANLMYGNSSATVPTNSPDNDSTANLMKYPSKSGNTTVADSRKYHVHVYFVAPCSLGSGTNDVCQGGDDAIPTLKRLELTSNGTSTIMNVVPLVEGIEYMKLEYGIDTAPTTVNEITGQQGDGIPDTYVTTPTVAQWPMVVSIKVHLLARSPEATMGYSDAKQYTLAGTTVAATNDEFKRHVFSSEIRLMNMGGRREIPE